MYTYGRFEPKLRGITASELIFSSFLIKRLDFSTGKIMDFNLLIQNIPIQETCKFEMLIFKSAQVIKYYVMFAFLFVQTINN